MSTKFHRRDFLAGSVATGLAATGPFTMGKAFASDGVIKVGFVGPLTGFVAPWGLPGYNGCKLLADWYNSNGGVKVGGKRYTIEVVAYDDGWDATKALTGAKKLVWEDEVNFIIGDWGSPVKSMQSFLTDQKMLSTTLVQYDTDASYPYMIAPAQPFPYDNIPPAVHFANKYGSEFKKVAICGQNEEVGLYGIASFSAVLEAAGMEIVEQNVYSVDTTDFAPIVSSMLASKPDVLCWGTSWPDFTTLLNEQAFLQGWRGPLMSSACDNCWQVIGKTSPEFVEGYVHAYPDFDDPRMQHADVPFPSPAKFYAETESRWPGTWNSVSFLYPFCLSGWVNAVEAAGSYQPMDVLEAWKSMDPVPHIFGPGRWRGAEMNGIDNSIVGVWPAVEMRNSKSVIVDMVDVNGWLDENLGLLKKHYEKMGLA